MKPTQKMLKSYFHSNREAWNPSQIIIPAHTYPHFFSEANSFGYKDDSLSTSMCNNSTLKLICHGGLPIYIPSILEVCQKLDLGDNAKPPQKNEKKLWNITKIPRHLDYIVSFG